MAIKDLTGQQFYYWTVLENTGIKTSDRDIYWKCKCKCGTIKNVRGSSLRKGSSKSCGCLKKEKLSARKKDIANLRFDKLVAIEPTDKRQQGAVIWKCQCDCGNICYRSITNLQRKNEFHSCGCFQQQQVINLNKKNLIGLIFGRLQVVEETPQRTSGGSIIWKCKCDCGNITYVSTNSLTTGNTQSCGCITKSIGEANIEKILLDNNIKFKREWSTAELDLKRFDFCILNNNNQVIRLIEFDGKQHFEQSPNWEPLEDIQKRDKIKNEYALSHNIPLIRIPYWERDNITLEMLLGEQYLVKS